MIAKQSSSMAMLTAAMFYIYDAFVMALYFLILLPAKFIFPTLRQQLRDRPFWRMPDIKPPFNKLSCLYFCSSAGEYEQAKPLMARLEAMGYSNYICFFSASGRDYARKRGEQTPYFLAPPDRYFYWLQFFKLFRPTFVLVIRYELWPGFIAAAQQKSQVYLINFGQYEHKKQLRFWERWILNRGHHIFCVDQSSVDFLIQQNLHTPATLSGDTKFDRAVDRAKSTALSSPVRDLVYKYRNGRRVLIIGSAWHQDIEVLLTALTPSLRERIFLVVVPHLIDRTSILELKQQLSATYDKHLEVFGDLRADSLQIDALIMDRMGLLAELYSCGDAALVGGAFHHRVHNVLEPAIYDLPLAFGPHYQTAHEAATLVGLGMATVCPDAEDLERWLTKICFSHETLARPRRSIVALTGASDRLVSYLRGETGDREKPNH